jgi:tetratricopeptide (TPR) repeat protein
MQKYGEAVKDYPVALQLEPENATAYHNRGSLFERLGKTKVRQRCYSFTSSQCLAWSIFVSRPMRHLFRRE